MAIERAGPGEGIPWSGSTRGRLLVASPLLRDPNFLRTVVLVIEHNVDGALGVVLNRPSELPLVGTIATWTDAFALPPLVFRGGPVDLGALLLVGVATGGEGFRVVDVAGDPEAGIEPGSLRLFAGYAGWGPDQLEGELAEDAWLVLEAEPGDLTSPEPERLWDDVLRRQGGWVALLAGCPPTPWLN